MKNEKELLLADDQDIVSEIAATERIDDRMVWSYDDWTSNDGNFTLAQRTLTLISPNRLEVVILITSHKTKTVKHPGIVIKIFDQQGALLINWSSGEFILDCNSHFYYSKKADLTPFYTSAFKATWAYTNYTFKKC